MTQVLNKLILLAFCCLTLTSFAKGYLIEATISGAENRKVYLQEVAYSKKKVDSTIVKQGKFVFKGKVSEVQQWEIVVAGAAKSLRLLADNEKITIDGKYSTWEKATIQNAKWQQEWEKFQQQCTPFFAKSTFYMEKLGKYEGKDTVLFKKYSDSLNYVESLRLKYVENFVLKHPKEFTSLYALVNNYFYFSAEKNRKLIQSLSPKLQKHSFVGVLLDEISFMNQVEIGAVAPIFSQKDT
ncbi:MAG: DUF4369 domain-containing protein, partial [Bacteroidia bacterium]